LIKIAVLSSGSCGNATFISNGKTRLLVDAGLSRNAIDKGLASIGEDPIFLDAILITHEHVDHTRGLRGMIGRYQTPVLCTEGTYRAIEPAVVETAGVCHRIAEDSIAELGSFSICPIGVRHNANQPVGYVFIVDGRRISIFTDLGYVDTSTAIIMAGSDFLFLESNHDVDAVKMCSRPDELKQRILRDHLSNTQVAEFVREYGSEQTKHLVLGHLSDDNNLPELVHATTEQALRSRFLSTHLTVLPHGAPSDVYTF
jgi:phosphoribosyl 1,2-cyclic phosphodiesterase